VFQDFSDMDKTIILPKPNTDGTVSLEQAILLRRSRRNFTSKPLTLEQIGQLAWAAQGQEPRSSYRNAPSAGATYPLELFVVNSDGIFQYLPDRHALENLNEQDVRAGLASAALGQEPIAEAPITVVLTADFSRTARRYGKRGSRYTHIEVGHAAQNIHLQAQALGLGSVPIGAFNDSVVSKVLSLPHDLEPLYLVPVGYFL
jgi:SagB-type dehydrogenase family enzyme